jgi:hypothetical protein
MPYRVGAKGSYGCSGYPALKDDGTVMGCHQSKAEAEAQIYAINQSEGNIENMDSENNRYKNINLDRSIFNNSRSTKTKRLNQLFKRERTMATRRRLAEEGLAMPDGSYPIVTVEDLRNAIQAFGRTDNPRATKEHIMRRARALGRTDLIPENWK